MRVCKQLMLGEVPRLAKQRNDYRYKAMRELRDTRRQSTDTTMSAAVFGLIHEDIRALEH